ncbi:LLM class flavin-dependent oxidoreductase [Brachybacterium endophyticum]|uniref:LLM class flavin-dependent oxidoreductase n=1 Tax=Brachybacterium endophyticum TaxID=2182385 RepID=A0A2U2RIC3_9MICO|nr:LLM class flavin-dependent oxidoreductase [Brachybacterium endophyticum]
MLAFVDHTGIARARSQGLDDGLDLFERMEDLGIDAGYVRHRHLQDYLSSPLPFLAAASQRTSTMTLGTALIPLRFEQPGRLAEDAASVDLLSGGRLYMGVGSGYAKQDAVNERAYGSLEGDVRARVDSVLADLLSFVDGEVVATADEFFETEAVGTPLRVRPQAPGLRSRIAYGAGSITSAERAGRLGIGLQVSTLQPADDSGRSFEELQAELIEAYRAASRASGHGAGHVSASRQMLPAIDPADLEGLEDLIARDRDRQQAMREGTAVIGGRPAAFGRVVAGDPEEVARFLAEDVALQAADETVLALPFGHPYPVVRRLASTFAESVAPLLRAAWS